MSQKRVAILQARMTSTRLPGKVLAVVGGKPILAQEIRRLKRCLLIDEIVIATSSNLIDRPIADLARQEGVAWFCGSEQDVLGRFVGAALQSRADIIVRVTADCPLIDPGATDRVIDELENHMGECDYTSNVLRRTYPRGLDVEAFFLDTLLRMDRLGQSKSAREHVTALLRFERPELFLLRSVEDVHDNSDLRWTVDTEADLTLIRTLYNDLNLDETLLPYPEMLAYVRSHLDLNQINAGVETWEPQANDRKSRL